MKSILTLPTAFVLFVLFSFAFSSCKKCSKDESGNTNNTPSDTTTSSSVTDGNSKPPDGSGTTGSNVGSNLGEGEDIPADGSGTIGSNVGSSLGEGEDIPALVPLTPAQLEAKTKQNKVEAARDEIARKLQEAQVAVKKMIEDGATKASSKGAKNKVNTAKNEVDKLFEEIEAEIWDENDLINNHAADWLMDNVWLDAAMAVMGAYGEAISLVAVMKATNEVADYAWNNREEERGYSEEIMKLKMAHAMNKKWLEVATTLEDGLRDLCLTDKVKEAKEEKVEGKRRVGMALMEAARRVFEPQIVKARKMAAEAWTKKHEDRAEKLGLVF
jgi:hypothetical protein